MTDLPQLQTLLVDAAVKRRRRRRTRRFGVPLLVAAVLAITVPWVLQDAGTPDREVPAVTPAPAPRVEDAFAPLREPASEPSPGGLPGDVQAPLDDEADLLLRDGQLCLMARGRYECGAAAEYVAGHKILALVVNDWAYAVFPDGVKSVLRTWYARGSTRYAVVGNLVKFKAPTGSGSLQWQAPDGSTRRTKLRDISNPRMWYRQLGMPETDLDREAGFPGARFLIGAPDGRVRAWLVPRREAICLLVRIGEDQRSVCRSPVLNTPRPLMVSMPSQPERVVVLAFASFQKSLRVTPERARRTIFNHAALILDGDTARKIHFGQGAGQGYTLALPSDSLMGPTDREISPDELPAEP